MPVRRVARGLLWIIQILAMLAFIAIGVAKFRNVFWIKAFPRWGYSDGFRMLIGVIEIAGGALLAPPQTTFYAAAFLVSIMIGAISTLMINHEPIFPPLFWAVVLSAIGVARRRRAWRPSAREPHASVEQV